MALFIAAAIALAVVVSRIEAVSPSIDRSLKKACGVVSVTVPPSLLRLTDTKLVGLYTLQYETFDSKPVYKQYTWLCNPKAILASGSTTGSDEKISCKVKPEGASPNFFYYDDSKKFWKLPPKDRSANVLYFRPAAAAATDTSVMIGKWS